MQDGGGCTGGAPWTWGCCRGWPWLQEGAYGAALCWVGLGVPGGWSVTTLSLPCSCRCLTSTQGRRWLGEGALGPRASRT